jgi:4'-phosphopantetheinyl transferase EntD
MGALEALFQGAVYTAAAEPRLVDAELLPEEWAHIQGAVAKRRAEFGTARLCARRGLTQMGVAPIALVPGIGGYPTWPPSIVGSIAHTDGYCAVALAYDPPVRAIGLDVETLRHLEPGVTDAILLPREREWLEAHSRVGAAAPEAGTGPADPLNTGLGPADPRDALAILFFSAKEAYYKCQYPLTRRVLDFVDVEVDLAMGDGRFVARVRKPSWPVAFAEVGGRFAFENGRVLCGVELRA